MPLLTASLDAHAQALTLLAERQKVLAGNIANADTPGYQARDFDFAQALAAARAGNGVGGMQATNAAHLGAAGGTPGDPALQWRTPEQPSLDGNTVDLDKERARFADNAMRYEATLRFINNDVRQMLSAITGQ
ncbi:flagellar basal body rod protein FlgB [Ramlibacter sp. MMS24-I3-19]|uniref:flagellar basal body rod protein FlgB n=1 Tax=Ramlibacter sp. MMS24-I3-19 TaxID=3416606 RepID=UPI003D07A3DD